MRYCVNIAIFAALTVLIVFLCIIRDNIPFHIFIFSVSFAGLAIAVYAAASLGKSAFKRIKDLPEFLKPAFLVMLAAVLCAAGIFLIPYFAYLLANYLHHFGDYYLWAAHKAVTASADKSAEGILRGISNADYLDAAATIIGAFIALIPVVWLIEQNRQNRIQIRLQQTQNNAVLFVDACSLITANLESKTNASFISIRAGISLLRNVAKQEKEYYAWAAMKALIDVYEAMGEKFAGNVLNAFEVIVESVKESDTDYDTDCIKAVKAFLRDIIANQEGGEMPDSTERRDKNKIQQAEGFVKRAEKLLRALEDKFPDVK